MIDVAITSAKEREKERDAKYAASWDNSGVGDAGVEKTRRQKPTFSDKQRREIEKFVDLVPEERRTAFLDAVLARLSGFPGDAAVRTSCRAAAIEDGFISIEALDAHNLVSVNVRGFVRPPPEHDHPKWKAKAVMGTGR